MADGLPELLVQSILQAFNAGKSGAFGDSADDKLAVDTADTRRRVAAGADATERDPSLGAGRFARPVPTDDAPFRPQPATPGRLDGFLAAQTPENDRKADAMFAGDENLATWTGRNTPKGFAEAIQAVGRGADRAMDPVRDAMNYKPGTGDESVGKTAFNLGGGTLGAAGVTRTALGAAERGTLGSAGGKLPAADDMPGIITSMKQHDAKEFTRLYTSAYEALAADIPALREAASTAKGVARPMSSGQVATDKLAKAGGGEVDRIGEIAERAAAFSMWQRLNSGESSVSAFGSAPRNKGGRPPLQGEGFDGYGDKLRAIVDARDPTTPAKEVLREYRKLHGDKGVSDGTLLTEIGRHQRDLKREAVDTIYKMPTTQDILKRAAEGGERNLARVANDIRNALDIPATSRLVTTADIHAQLAKMRGVERPPAPKGGARGPNRDAELLNSPQIEQLIAQADARGESAGMVTNMVRRAMGLSAGGQHRSSGVTTDAIAAKIGELRDKARRTRGAGDE